MAPSLPSTKTAAALVLGGAAIGAAAAILYTRRSLSRRRSGKYCAGVIRAKPDMIEQYMALHDHTWDEVMAKMYACNMRDFTVWLHEESGLMFHQFVYVGEDFERDMAAVGEDPIVRFWWTYCEPCQEPFHWAGPPPSQGGTGDPKHPGEWWAPLKQVNHCGAWSVAYSDRWPDPDFATNHPRGITTTKDRPPAVHNRTGPAAGWTTYKQAPFVASKH